MGLSALGIYDYCLTFNQEIRQVWQRKVNWISILFYVNRYTIIATSIVILIKDLRFIPPTSLVSPSCSEVRKLELKYLPPVCSSTYMCGCDTFCQAHSDYDM